MPAVARATPTGARRHRMPLFDGTSHFALSPTPPKKRCTQYCSVSNAWSLEHARALLPAHVCPHESSLLVLLARLGASTMVRLQPVRHCMSAVVAPHSIASHPAPCVRVRSEPPPRPIRLRVCKCLTP